MPQRRRRAAEGSKPATPSTTRTDQDGAVEAPAADVRRTTKPGLRLLRGDRRARYQPVSAAPAAPVTDREARRGE